MLLRELLRHVLAGSLVRVGRDEGELLPACHRSRQPSPHSVYDRSESSDVPWVRRVLHVVLVDLVPQAVVLVASPSVKLAVLSDHGVVVAAAADRLARNLVGAEMLDHLGSNGDGGVFLPELAVEAGSPSVAVRGGSLERKREREREATHKVGKARE